MVTSRTVLVVDDDRAMREMLAALFKEQGLEVREAASADEALAQVSETDFDAVLSDIKMPGKSGIELLGELHALRPGTPVVLMTAFGSIDSVVDAMRAGAVDYVTKPFEPEAVLFTMDRVLERRALEEENRRLRRAVDQTSRFGDLMGESPAMREIFALIRKLSHNRSSVLLTGESGTGKEVVARTIHYSGVRSSKPFVPVNCSAIPEGLLESELFGHVRGAFTGAHASKKGLFEHANGGTLFLDEIGDMGLGLQSKLLRVLQDGEVRPVGSAQSLKVDVRVISATNRDLQQDMESGRFREDLFYRLNVIPIHLPPLRERPEDIPSLVESFLRKHASDGPRSFSQDALTRLISYPWKGNARELENVVERALALSESPEVGPAELPLAPPQETDGPLPTDAFIRSAAQRKLCLREVEELYIEEILRLTGGNKVQASRILGIDRKTLYRRAERSARQRGAAEAS